MPYKDKESQRAYQREWVAKRRLKWLTENGPCVDCGSWDDLEVDHSDASLKVSHRVWSWSDARRTKELAKCVVRCHDCHAAKRIASDEYSRGVDHGKVKLTAQQVVEIRNRHSAGEKQAVLAKEFNVNKATINKIVLRLRWKHI